jgi:peptide/nickel transport system substrate-binding protein
MAQDHSIDDDGLRWTIRLRPRLTFHDGAPVRARDCTASLVRWMKRDSLGQSLALRLAALEAPDDATIVIRLRKPFPPLAYALAKVTPPMPVIMPERLASTDAFKQVSEAVGSGPFQFLAGEHVPGSRVAFARFEGYQAREEAPSFTAGGKRARLARVEWRTIPEPATAANALIAGEVDWLELPLPDLLPALAQAPGVTVDRLDPFGLYPVLRFNHLHRPTSNAGFRRAVLAAIDQREAMQAVMGDDTSAFAVPVGCFLPASNAASGAGLEALGPKPKGAVTAMLRDAGYGGERVVVMHPTDQPLYDAMTQVVVASLRGVGITVDDQAMDWGTVVQRRASKEPLDRGGWSMFCASFPGMDYLDPLVVPAVRANGPGAWYGWPEDGAIEALREAWMDALDPAERRRIAGAIQAEVLAQAIYMPLGQYFQKAAWRRGVDGVLKGPAPVFWNVGKS